MKITISRKLRPFLTNRTQTPGEEDPCSSPLNLYLLSHTVKMHNMSTVDLNTGSLNQSFSITNRAIIISSLTFEFSFLLLTATFKHTRHVVFFSSDSLTGVSTWKHLLTSIFHFVFTLFICAYILIGWFFIVGLVDYTVTISTCCGRLVFFEPLTIKTFVIWLIFAYPALFRFTLRTIKSIFSIMLQGILI